MEESPSPLGEAPPPLPPSPGEELRAGFASFDAASFLALQQNERERKAADLLAAANALCPSSNEDDSSSSVSTSEASSHDEQQEEEEGEIVAGQKRKATKKPAADKKHFKKRKKHPKKHKSNSKGEEKRKSSKESLPQKERRRRGKKAAAEFSKQVAAELAAGEGSRRSSLHPFSSLDQERKHGRQEEQQQVYFSQKKPDSGNIAFGKLYRFDVPRYRRYDPTGYISRLLKTAGKEGNDFSENKKIEKEKRRKKVAMWWRPRGLESSRSRKADFFVFSHCEYLSLDPSKDKALSDVREDGISSEREKRAAEQEEGEKIETEALFSSPEEYLLQKTRDFNAALRQNPENLQLWLDFSAFQDEAMKLSSRSCFGGGQNKRQRGAARATAEKQISILERGLEHHPGSDVLLLALLDVASKICDHEEMEKRWQRVLVYCPTSVKLWKAYLRKKRENFAIFKAGEVATAHYQALVSLENEISRLQDVLSSVENPEEVEKLSIQLAELDHSLVEMALLAISMRLQTGHTELGIAAVRVVLEYNWFAPEGWPEDALKMMFAEFFRNYYLETGEGYSDGGQKLIGDSGAVGWGTWISGEDSFRDEPAAKEEQKEEAPGGWVEVEGVPREEVVPREGITKTKPKMETQAEPSRSPWEELASAIRARFGHALEIGEAAHEALQEERKEKEEEEKEEEERSAQEVETDEQLLARLGMDLDAALADAEEELTPEVLSTWLDIECQRDSQQWEASRNIENEDERIKIMENEVDQEIDENLSSQVTWEDLSPYLVSIQNKEAREKLLTGCLQLLGVSLSFFRGSGAISCLSEIGDEISVAASWLGIGGNSFEAVDPSASVAERLEASEWAWLNGRAVLTHAVRDMPWWAVTKERHQFVLNILTTLMRNADLKNDYELAFATLNLASWSVAPFSSSSSSPQEKEQEEEQSSVEIAVPPIRDWASGRALAKHLLSEQRNNLVLYAAFAALENASGRAKAAKKVYTACLSGLQRLSEGDRDLPAGLIELILGLSQLELENTATASKRKNEPNTSTSVCPISMLSLLRAVPEAVQAAARPLLFLGSQGKISLAFSAGASNLITQEEIVEARRGYQDAVLRMLRAGPEGIEMHEAVAQLSVAVVAELVFAACSTDVGGGVKAALALYQQVIGSVSSSSSASTSSIFLERIEMQRCALAVDAAAHAVHVVPPSLAREILSNALQRYPASPHLLRMLRSLEVNSHALTALRRQLNSLLSSSPSAPAWLMLVGVEIGNNAARTAIRAAFLRAVSCSTSPCSAGGMHSPVLWRCYLRFERAFGTPDSLHRTFLRAVEACPWSKSLWIDGLELLNGYSSPKELSEYLNIIKDKELVVRTDILEAVLSGLQ